MNKKASNPKENSSKKDDPSLEDKHKQIAYKPKPVVKDTKDIKEKMSESKEKMVETKEKKTETKTDIPNILDKSDIDNEYFEDFEERDNSHKPNAKKSNPIKKDTNMDEKQDKKDIIPPITNEEKEKEIEKVQEPIENPAK